MGDKVIYHKREIEYKVPILAEEISHFFMHKKEPLLALCVLKGGFMFFRDLVSHLDPEIKMESGFCRVRTYHNQKKEECSQLEVNENVIDRNVLIIDDICDSGQTINLLTRTLKLRGAKEIYSVVAIHRLGLNQPVKPDWSLFQHVGEEWFYGYGMNKDDKGTGRNRPHVFAIDEEK